MPTIQQFRYRLIIDKIKVLTDKDIGYAIPAECNVDIVPAIPTNGAANNISNYDAASSTAGSPYYVAATTDIPANVKTTPIYQMGQACKRFVKNHFYHVKGVNVGLIPYSGKVSISPDKTSYTSVIAQLSSYYFISNPLNYKTIRGVFLYSTKGKKMLRYPILIHGILCLQDVLLCVVEGYSILSAIWK